MENLNLPEPFACDYGGSVESIQVGYESWGTLNADKNNVVLVVHFIASDCHVTGEFAGQATGWWEALVGPGRVIDTDRYFVVCPNLLGGCHGTTGPRTTNPATGSPYATDFPLVTPRDLMRVQRRFLEALGITGVELVLGPSMGGMVAWEWAVEAGDWVRRVAAVGAPPVTTAHEIGLNWVQRRALAAGGEKAGQALARGMGMLSYRSPEGLTQKFGRTWFREPGPTLAEPGLFNVESWLRHHGKRSVKSFDPLTYDLFARCMDLHDLGRGRGGLEAALGKIMPTVLGVGISHDCLYPPGEVEAGIHQLLRTAGKKAVYREINSVDGHDAFLLATDQLQSILGDFLLMQ